MNVKTTPLTPRERQARRRQKLDKIAQGWGFSTWRKLETGLLRGDFVLAVNPNFETKRMKALWNAINSEKPA